jgi:RNA polymerase sigma-70 factor (ECF subfamily)
LIEAAEQLLMKAASFGRPGRFQLEAAIQSAHAEPVRVGTTDWNAIACFYEHLVRLSRGAGARTGNAAAIANCKGPQAGLVVLDEMANVCGPGFGEASSGARSLRQGHRLVAGSAVRGFLVRAQSKIPLPAL